MDTIDKALYALVLLLAGLGAASFIVLSLVTAIKERK